MFFSIIRCPSRFESMGIFSDLDKFQAHLKAAAWADQAVLNNFCIFGNKMTLIDFRNMLKKQELKWTDYSNNQLVIGHSWPQIVFSAGNTELEIQNLFQFFNMQDGDTLKKLNKQVICKPTEHLLYLQSLDGLFIEQLSISRIHDKGMQLCGSNCRSQAPSQLPTAPHLVHLLWNGLSLGWNGANIMPCSGF